MDKMIWNANKISNKTMVAFQVSTFAVASQFLVSQYNIQRLNKEVMASLSLSLTDGLFSFS